MEILKILSIILISTVLCIIFKNQRGEYSFFMIVCCSIIVLTMVIKSIISPLEIIEQRIESYGIDNSYFKVALKALGIGYITAFIADSCRDAGLSSLALKAELAGKCAIFLLSVPLVLSILETAIGFVK